MKIDVLTVVGSPKNVTSVDVFDRGVGGAELALISWAEVMAKRGHKIRIYNQTSLTSYHINGVEYLPDGHYNTNDDRDILVTFRGPQELARHSNAKKRIGWSCDQYTVGDYNQWYMTSDKIILISPFHQKDHLQRYGQIALERGQVIDLGVRTWEYVPVEKTPYSFIFCSVPDRGLMELANLWPEITNTFPQATLTITSDYTLWGANAPLNMQYRMRLAGMPGVNFLGNIPREDLVKEQSRAEVNLYPCIYDENFCIAIAECQVAGVYCITTNQGALATTNFTGAIFPPGPGNRISYLDTLQSFFNQPFSLRTMLSKEITKRAIARFDWDKIAEQWEQVFNE